MAGLVLLIAGVVLVPTFVALGAFRAKGASAAAQWGLWLGVVALAVGVLGAALPLWDKLVSSMRRPEASAENPQEELGKVVLQQAELARSRLLGAGEVGDQAANVRFIKGTGRYREVGGASTGDVNTVLTYYQSLSPRRLVILGDPGAGKTVLAMELLIGLLEQRKHDEDIPVPVLISAAAYDTGRPWEDWLAGHLAQRFSIEAGAAQSLVRDRLVLPVVDGLDEMDVAGESVRARALVAALNSFMQGRQRAAVVVTCRREEYQALHPGVDRATHIEMVPLDGSEAADYLADQLRGAEEEQAWQPVLKCLRADPCGLMAVQLATPWRLTLALAVFRDGGSPAELLPGPLLDPYAQRINNLLLGRYVPAAVRLHDPSGHHAPGQVQGLLTALAKDLDWQAHHNGSATDIELDKWWRPAGGRAAKLVHLVLVAVIAVPYLFVAAANGNVGWAMVGVGLLIPCAVAALDPVPNRANLQQLTRRRVLWQMAVRFSVLCAIGLPLGLVIGLATGVGVGAGLAIGFVLGLAAGVGTGLSTGLVDESPQAVGPQDVVRADGLYGLIVGLVVAVACGIAFGPGFALVSGNPSSIVIGLVAALVLGLAVGLGIGARAWTRYRIAVVIAALPPRSGPLRFGAALDWAYQAGLLRLSGVAYQFRHRQLQDWLMHSGSDRAVEKPSP
jgi:hypothetical protein